MEHLVKRSVNPSCAAPSSSETYQIESVRLARYLFVVPMLLSLRLQVYGSFRGIFHLLLSTVCDHGRMVCNKLNIPLILKREIDSRCLYCNWDTLNKVDCTSKR